MALIVATSLHGGGADHGVDQRLPVWVELTGHRLDLVGSGGRLAADGLARLELVSRQPGTGRLSEGDTGADGALHDGDALLAGGEHLCQRLVDAPRIGGFIQAIHEYGNGGNGEVGELAERLEIAQQANGATHELTGRKQLGSDGRESVIGSQDRHLQGDGARPLGVDQDEVIARQIGEQLGKPETAVRGVEQQLRKLAGMIVGDHYIQIGMGRLRYDAVGSRVAKRDQLIGAAGGFGAEGVVTGERRLTVQVDEQDPEARIGQEAAQIGSDGGLADPALGRNNGYNAHNLTSVPDGNKCEADDLSLFHEAVRSTDTPGGGSTLARKLLISRTVCNGAGTRSRTRDLLITSQLLYQLSYAGNGKTCKQYKLLQRERP